MIQRPLPCDALLACHGCLTYSLELCHAILLLHVRVHLLKGPWDERLPGKMSRGQIRVRFSHHINNTCQIDNIFTAPGIRCHDL